MLAPVDAPFVLVLNGVPGSGKSTLAQALQEALPQPWVRLGVDDFLRLVPLHRTDLFSATEAVVPLVSGRHRAMAALAAAGNRIIIDHVLAEEWLASDLATALGMLPTLCVTLACSVQVAQQRQLARGREVGVTSSHAEMIDRHVVTT